MEGTVERVHDGIALVRKKRFAVHVDSAHSILDRDETVGVSPGSAEGHFSTVSEAIVWRDPLTSGSPSSLHAHENRTEPDIRESEGGTGPSEGSSLSRSTHSTRTGSPIF